MRRPISLSDSAMRLIRESAKPIPVQWRQRFLEAVADRLLPHDAITDDAVSDAVQSVLVSMFRKAMA